MWAELSLGGVEWGRMGFVAVVCMSTEMMGEVGFDRSCRRGRGGGG